MNAFQRVQLDVRENQIYRDTLLAQPPEFFRVYLGTVPDMMQKAHLVERMIRTVTAAVIFVNETYRVRVRDASPFVQLEISRRDGQPCANWRHFQQIKNELIGPESEGVELFPAESRLVDTSNQYHMWVIPDAKYRFPFGYPSRMVQDAPYLYQAKPGEQLSAPAHQTVPADRATSGVGLC